MRRFFFLTLATLAVEFGLGTKAIAQGFEASPFQLVNLAYEGYLETAGVPSHGRLEDLYNRHDIDEDDIVVAGIAAGYLPETRRDDSVFLNAVRSQMRSLQNRDRYFDW